MLLSNEDYERIINHETRDLADDISRLAKTRRNDHTKASSLVAATIQEEWSEGWELYDEVLWSLHQAAYQLVERLNETDDDHSVVRESLTLIYFNSLQLIQEIETLLRAGLWAGGAARWRALHELTVTASLLAANDAHISTRYLDHGFVVRTRRLRSAMDNYGRGPTPEAELRKQELQADALCKKHAMPDADQPFHKEYSWALPLMELTRFKKRVRPSLPVLESLAELTDWRELVSTSHGLVHADSAGVRTAVLGDNGSLIGVPTEKFIPTVARPAMLLTQHLVAAVTSGFEADFNEFLQSITIQGKAITHMAECAANAFPLSESPEHLSAGGRPT